MKNTPLRPALATLVSGLLVAAPALADPWTAPRSEELAGENLSTPLEELRAKAGAPGVVALAYQDGEVIAWGAAGVRAQGGEEPISISDPMHLGSCAKAMTATLVARLVEDGVLGWDTPLATALPDFAAEIDPGYGPLTPLTFLQHRAGIAERRRPEIGLFFPFMKAMQGTGPEVRREILQRVLSVPPSAPAQGTFDYSNYGYMTAGLLLQGVTGESWEELMLEHLFRPLGLESAGIGSPAGEHVPVGHVDEDGAWKALPPGPGGVLPEAMGPAGLVHMNLADWATFVAHHLAGHRGEDGFLSAQTYAKLHTDPEASGYAAGWGVTRHSWSWGEGAVLTHNGSDTTWHSVVWALPEFDLTVVTAANCGDTAGSSATEEARKLLLTTLGYRD